MALYVVLSPNCPYFTKGDFVEDGDDGCVQRVRTSTTKGRLAAGGFEGLTVPMDAVRGHLLRIQKKELDKSW
jgi:hypothetical protein